MNTLAFSNGLVIYIQSDAPTQGQLDTAQQLPGLMQMMPTHNARMNSTTWTIHKQPIPTDDEPGMFVIALKSSLDDEQVEHAEYNTGMIGENLVCLEYIGCEMSSENWYPDTGSSKTTFTDDELSMIFNFLDKHRNLLP